jgi:Tol biopolymer transport system component
VSEPAGSLQVGQRLGVYQLQAQLGEGGMGVVYRALDTRLNRPVAIKFLSEDLADPAGRRRFQLEAQTASSLNHPHILTVHEVGEVEGRQYLVSEFVDGGTLRDWLRAEKRTWRQIVDLLVGVADGLAAAHQANMLHRDIKPDNILVTTRGYAKLADFGLAKLQERTGSEGLTDAVTVERTRPGVVIGTVAYMSPEQAAGKALDARSDIFSFGVVLCELLAGQRPFTGKTDLEVLQAIQHQTPAPLPPDLPVGLRLAVDKALEKDPADRYQTMRDLVVDLRRVSRARGEKILPVPAVVAPVRSRWWSAAAVVVALTAGVAVSPWVWGSRQAGWRNPLEGASYTRLTDFEGIEDDAVLSPDGNFVAFLSSRSGPLDVWILQIGSGQFLNLTQGKFPNLANSTVRVLGFSADGSQVTMLTTTDGGPGTSVVPTLGGPIRLSMEGRLDPQWTPDGKQLLFVSQVGDKDVMYVADRDGTSPREVFPVKPGEHNHFMTWSPSGRYVYSVRSTQSIFENDIWRAPATGGEPERVTNHNGFLAYPTLIDEDTLLYVGTDANGAGPWLYAVDLDSREEHRLSGGIEQYSSIAASAPVGGRSRRLVATVVNPVSSLWSLPISPSIAPESAASGFELPAAQVSYPRFGPDYMLYLSARELADSLWKFQGGTAVELWKASNGAVLASPAVSRDGKQIAFTALRQGRAGLHVMTADGANPRLLAPSIDVRGEPSFSPDGKTIAVTGSDEKGPGLFLVSVDGGGPRQLYDKICYAPLWSPDGQSILVAEFYQGPLMHLKALALDGKPLPLPEIQLRQTQLARSPVPYRLLPDGKSLVMEVGSWRSQQFWLVDLATGQRRQLTNLRPGRSIRGFDVTPDGKSILFDRVQENSDIVLIDLAQGR